MALLIIILIVLAILLLVAELFVIGGVLGAFGFLLILLAAGLSFYHFGTVTGLVVLIGSGGLAVIILVVGFRLISKSPLSKHLFLSDSTSKKEGFASTDNTLNQYLHKTGVTFSELRPSGLAELDGERITVSTEGEFMEKGTPIEVIDIRYNQVIVRKRD